MGGSLKGLTREETKDKTPSNVIVLIVAQVQI